LGGSVKPTVLGFTRHFWPAKQKASHWRVAQYAVFADCHQNSGQHDSTTTAILAAAPPATQRNSGQHQPTNQPTRMGVGNHTGMNSGSMLSHNERTSSTHQHAMKDEW